MKYKRNINGALIVVILWGMVCLLFKTDFSVQSVTVILVWLIYLAINREALYKAENVLRK
jgi:hypothetical protein